MISAERACQYTNEEISSWNLNDTVNAAVQEWNEDVFSTIRVPTDDSQNRTELVLLYSSLYFMHLMPSDRTDENPLWPSTDSWYVQDKNVITSSDSRMSRLDELLTQTVHATGTTSIRCGIFSVALYLYITLYNQFDMPA